MTTPNIVVERYDPATENGAYQQGWGGVIQDEAQSWIIFTDTNGRPKLYWGERDELGGVVGEPVQL